IPTTVFLVSDFMDGKLWLWQYRVHHALRQTKRTSLSLPLPSGAPLELRFETPEQRVAAASEVAVALNGVPNSERLRLLDLLPGLLDVEIPNRPPPEHAPLSWSEVRNLAHDQGGVEFGAHTRTHPILSMVEGREELRGEIEGSKVRIEEELQEPVIHFCYPNGLEPHLDDRVVAEVGRSGFRTAVTAILGLNFAGADPLRLYRVGVEPTMPPHQFREAVAGVQSYLYSSRMVKRIAGV
ncbi:MAG: polysaccharide deacetylase family protein, partial [Chloroflexota bacterium]|nr:polysaccharide deacetylase family protein [Chloroflexota bacterium]